MTSYGPDVHRVTWFDRPPDRPVEGCTVHARQVAAPPGRLPRMSPAERDRMLAAAELAPHVLPPAVGWLVARELRWHLDTDWRLDDTNALAWRLVAEVDALAAQTGSERRCAEGAVGDMPEPCKSPSVALRAPHGGTAGEVHQ